MAINDLGGTPSSVETINFDSMPSEDLDAIIASGGQVPEKYSSPAPAKEDPAPEPEQPETPEGEEEEDRAPEAPKAAPDERVEPAKEEGEAEAEAETEVEFKFTENADAETRAKERKDYLAQFDLPKPMQDIFEELATENEELRTASTPQADETTRAHMSAFDRLVEFKQDGDTFVPDTEGIRTLFQSKYGAEYAQLVKDINAEDSVKYPGYTRLQEFVRDGFNLDENAMQTLDLFLENGGQMPVPAFVPDGIKPELAEAYWKAFDRDEVDERLRKAVFTLGDAAADDDERMAANLEISKLNSKLAQVQNGLNFDRNQKEEVQKARVATQQTIVNDGLRNYVNTTLKLLENTRTELAGALTMFDADTAGLAAAGVAELIENALSNADEYATAAQAVLERQGIKLDWAAAKGTLERLWQCEQKIAALDHLNKKGQINPRAIELAKKEKVKILLEIRAHEKTLIGKVSKKLAGGAGEALKTKLKDAPTLKIVRPRVKGEPKPLGGVPDFDGMSKEELDSYIGEKKYLEAQRSAGSS